MKDVIFLILDLLTAVAKLLRPGGSRAVITENLLLKQQLIIHSRSRQRVPNLTTQDRTVLGFLSLFLNPRHLVRRILASHYRPGQRNHRPSWLALLGHAKDSLWSLYLFRAESITLKTYWIMVVMDQYTRGIIGFAVHAGYVDGYALCRLFNDAISCQRRPIRLSSDNDPLFQYYRWTANLRVLDIAEIKSLPHVPTSHPSVERLIGRVRRELLDQTLFCTPADLDNKLRDYQSCYKKCRTHSGRDGATPVDSGSENIVSLNDYRWKKHWRELFQLPLAA